MKMGKLLCWFYLLVGLLSSTGMVTALVFKEVVLFEWLLLSALINFAFLYIIWKEERKKEAERESG